MGSSVTGMPARRWFTEDEYLFLEKRSFEKSEYLDGTIYDLNSCDGGDPMSAMPMRKRFTEEEYMLLEKASPVKSEYYNGEIFAMAGATYSHARIAGNLFSRLDRLLEGQPCEPLANDMMVKIEATGLCAYPDVIVVRDRKEFFDDEQRVLANPAIVMEVLSDSTEKYDRTVKLRHYKQIPSLKEIVLVSQDEPAVGTYTRQDDGQWVHAAIAGLEQSLPFKTLGHSIPLAAVYDRITFPVK